MPSPSSQGVVVSEAILTAGPNTKIAERRADILGRPKMDRVLSQSHPEDKVFVSIGPGLLHKQGKEARHRCQ